MNKSTISKTQLLLIITICFFVSCNNPEKDWINAKMSNSITDYKYFIKKYPSSIYLVKAKDALDSLECIDMLKLNKANTLDQFLKNHAASNYLSRTPKILDSINWNIAIYSKDTLKYRKYINEHPNSSKIQQAEDSIWNIKWPPYKMYIDPASIIIYSHGKRTLIGRAFIGIVSDLETGKADIGPEPEPPYIIIWRNFTPKEKAEYGKRGLIPGVAYTECFDDKYKLVKKVDLSKSDKELCEEFGIKP